MDPENTPGMPPPGDTKSNFHAPYNSLQIGIVIAFGTTYLIATICLALRYFQTFKLVKKVELDLIIITISYGVALTYFITMVHLMEFGWGKHLWDVTLADLAKFNKALLPNTLTYLMTPSITKMAILAVLYRINPAAIYRYIVVGIGIAIFGYTLALCIITGGPCSPLKLGTTKCLENVALAQAVLNIASDLAVLAVPLPTILGLNLGLKQRITIGCILAVGSAVVICSIARLPYVLILDKTEDVTYTEAILGVWSIVEVNLGIICASAMRLKRLIVTYLPQLGFSTPRSGNTGNEQWGSSVRMDKSSGQRSYQLHSIQKGSQPPPDSRDIHVYTSYNIDVEHTRGDGGSTDEILTGKS